MAVIPSYLSLFALARAAAVDRNVVLRLMATGQVRPAALVKWGSTHQPLFVEADAVTVFDLCQPAKNPRRSA